MKTALAAHVLCLKNHTQGFQGAIDALREQNAEKTKQIEGLQSEMKDKAQRIQALEKDGKEKSVKIEKLEVSLAALLKRVTTFEEERKEAPKQASASGDNFTWKYYSKYKFNLLLSNALSPSPSSSHGLSMHRNNGKRVKSREQGMYDTISSETGYSQGEHTWQLKVTHIDARGSTKVGVITSTDAKRPEDGSDFYISAKANGKSYFYGCQSGKGYLNADGATTQGKPQLKTGQMVRVVLNCDTGTLSFFVDGKNIGQVSLPKGVKYYPALQLYAGYPVTFDLL